MIASVQKTVSEIPAPEKSSAQGETSSGKKQKQLVIPDIKENPTLQEKTKLVEDFVDLSGKTYEEMKKIAPKGIDFSKNRLGFVCSLDKNCWTRMNDKDHRYIFLQFLDDEMVEAA